MNTETNTITVNGYTLPIKEYNGQRVVTLREIDEMHGKSCGAARQLFNKNKQWLVEGEDYWTTQSHQAKELFGIVAPRGLTILTQNGYMLIAKSFKDNSTMKTIEVVMEHYFESESIENEDETKTIMVDDYVLPIKEYCGKRVVTLREIDEMHKRAPGTAGRNFRENKNRFIEGEDYFKVCADEIRRYKLRCISNKAHNDVYLFTMMGYLMLTKSLKDDLSWQIQRMLVNSYFTLNAKEDQKYRSIIEERERIIQRNLKSCYKDWCDELIEPLQIIQQHYGLTSQKAALARVYYIFEEIFEYSVNDAREVYIQNEYGKHDDYEAWKKRIRGMPMLKFIHEHPRFKYEIDRIIQDMAKGCSPTLPVQIPQEEIIKPMLN